MSGDLRRPSKSYSKDLLSHAKKKRFHDTTSAVKRDKDFHEICKALTFPYNPKPTLQR